MAALAPVREEVRSGLERAKLLPVGAGYAELTAGLANPWGGDLNAYVRAELGWHPTDTLTAFGFAQADRAGVQAGIGARLTW